MKKLLAIAAVAALAGCAPYVLVEPKRTSVDGAFTVDPQITWSRINPQAPVNQNLGPAQIWTADGRAIDEVALYPGIGDGQALAKSANPEDKLPVFRKGMTPSEVMELFEATIVRTRRTTLAETRNLRPAKFGNVDGFRFEMTYTPRDEVAREAIVTGTIQGDKLYLIGYIATRIYYFEKYEPIVEKMINSVEFSQGAAPAR